jgi:hypothetical protein
LRRFMQANRARLCAYALLLGLAPVASQAAPGDITIPEAQAPQVNVIGHYATDLGTTDAASQGSVTSKLIEDRPILRPGEILEFVPGMVVTQHSGDGKANQYFLRGYNLDHGTDFATYVEGMPVNMPTNGHGQGYADINFMIPELVSRIDFKKDPTMRTKAISRRPAARTSTTSTRCPGISPV